MHIFEDFELNKRANRIKDITDKMSDPDLIGVEWDGQKGNIIDEEKYERWSNNLRENGLRIARDFLNDILQDFNYIKNKVNRQNDIYIEISDTISVTVSHIISMPLNSINITSLRDDYQTNKTFILEMKSIIAEATKLMSIISNFDMSSHTRHVINQNINLINVLEKKVKPKSACYIATFVYGSYNNKEVLILRSYRDNVLSKYYFGRLLINIYYKISPKLIKYIGNNLMFKFISKAFIDKFISIIKK